MSDLDAMIRGSLARLAEPGDTAGVADAVAAKAAALGSAGGAAGGAAGVSAWVVPAVIGVIALGGGVAVGVASAGGDGGSSAAYAPLIVTPDGGIPAASCPGGSAVTELDGGARVLAIAQSEDGSFVAVRDPSQLGRTVWVQASLATPDAGADPSALPVESCAVASDAPSAEPSPSMTPSASATPEPTETSEPDETDEPEPKPTKTSKPDPEPEPQDTEKPTIQVGNFSPNEFYDQSNTDPGCAEFAEITVYTSDNVAVTNVTAKSNRAGVSATKIGSSGNSWTFRATASGIALMGSHSVTFTFTAVDAAGNNRAGTASVQVFGAGMCLT